MLTIVAKLQAAPGKEEQLKEAFTKMISAVKAGEQGKTLVYSLHVANDDPSTFLFYEQYADEDAMKAHSTSEHMGALNVALREGQLLAGRPTIERYTRIGGLD